MFRFVGFKTSEATSQAGAALLAERVPDKKSLLGDYKISRYCSGCVSTLFVRNDTRRDISMIFDHF
jgi:hypothetical protein